MGNQQIIEAAKLTAVGGNKFRVCLISEGESPRGKYPPEFFSPDNAQALAGALSFPKHPVDYDRPDQRDPLTAIGEVGDKVDIERGPDGKLGFWADYLVDNDEVANKLEKYGNRLGLSVFSKADGYVDPKDGKLVYTSIDVDDPYRSVDLVIAPGRGGGHFQKVAESLGLLPEASASAGENEVTKMDKELADKLDALSASIVAQTRVVEALVAKSGDSTPKVEELQAQVDTAAVDKIVEARLVEYGKAEGLISEAHLTKSQSDALRELALKGEDVTPHIEVAKKVLAEALEASNAKPNDATRMIAEAHLGGGESKSTELSVDIPGFGKAKVL